MNRTDDEIALACRIRSLEDERRMLAGELRDVRTLYNAWASKKADLEARLNALNDQIELLEQGQLVMGDREV